jgi:hypothetical protein
MIDPDGSAILGYTETLYSEHIGEAVDACIRARRFSLGAPGRRPRERRSAVTSIVHGYAGMEAVANIFRFELFENKEGRFYKPIDEDDAAVRRYLERWDWHILEERYAYLLKVRSADPLDPGLVARISEVRRLRHLLAHGHDAPGLILFDANDRDNVEIDVRHNKKFPHLKFADFNKLTHEDARKALEVVLRAVQHLIRAFGFLLQYVSYEIHENGALNYFGTRVDDPVDDVLQQIDSA